MIKKIFLIGFIFFQLAYTQNSYASISELNNKNVSIEVTDIFEKYTSQLKNKYSENYSKEKINNLLSQLYTLNDKSKLSGDKKIIVESLIKLSNEYIFQIEYKNNLVKSKFELNNYEISDYFENKITSKDSVFLENGVWYTYVFTSHLSFKSGVNPSLKDLEFNNIDTQNDLFFISDNNIAGFATQYSKVRLISDSIIYGIPNKERFLQEIRDDKFYLQDGNIDSSILDIKNTSINLVKSANNKEDKIKILYDYVLKNTQYTLDIDLEDKKIFSGIETYNNNSGVCEGYAKLFQYLLYFADIGDVDTIRGYVIDAQDYPNIGHAWVRIGDKYYDPTFDDPIGSTADKSYDEYLYFGLPKDLFYTNRYEYQDENKILEKAPLNYREQYVQKQLAGIFQKYRGKDYNILKELQFRDINNLDYFKELTLNDIYNSIEYIQVENFKVSSTNQYISNLQFYNINDKNIGNILNQIDYDFNKYTLIKWVDSDNKLLYRIGFNIEYNK